MSHGHRSGAGSRGPDGGEGQVRRRGTGVRLSLGPGCSKWVIVSLSLCDYRLTTPGNAK